MPSARRLCLHRPAALRPARDPPRARAPGSAVQRRVRCELLPKRRGPGAGWIPRSPALPDPARPRTTARRPRRPASVTRISRTGPACAARCGHTPSVSKMRRLPLPSALVRSSKLGWEAASLATASISATRFPVPLSASARLAPTRPPPTIATSTSVPPGGFMPRPSASRSRPDPSAPRRSILRARLAVTATSSSMRIADVPEAFRALPWFRQGCKCQARPSAPCPARTPAIRPRPCSRPRRARRCRASARCGA